MRKAFYIGGLMAVLTACGTVKFKQMALYDDYATPPPAAAIGATIYEDGVGTMWNSLEDCGDFEVTQEVFYTGNASIKLSWDKGKGCEWIGFGNSFNNWTATDMSQERLKKALTFYVRTQSKTANAIPIVAAMEDFSGGGSYHFIDAGKYLNGLVIDTNWKQIIVPLWDFPIREDEVDIYSIKQMQFQLEGAGSFYLDDIRLIDYTKEEYEAMRAEVELMKPKGNVEQQVYTEGQLVDDAWGYDEENKCQSLEEVSKNGNQQIKWTYAADCSWSKWGINWNGWYQMNFRGILDKAQIQFKVMPEGNAAFKVILQDFTGHSSQVYQASPGTLTAGQWHTISVPLSELNLTDKNFTLDQIKQLQFEGIGAGVLYVDDIKITGI